MSLELNLGVDFGTSFTKVCVRDTAGENSWIVSFGDSSELEDALLPTKIGICRDGRILAGLTQQEWAQQNSRSYTTIDFIKMRLANLYLRLDKEGWQFPYPLAQSVAGINLNDTRIITNLCAYYLSSVISRAKNWVLQHNADLVRNQEINWSVNIGVPVQYADSDVIAGFRDALYLAWLLSESHSSQLNISQLNSQLHDLTQRLAHNSDLPCFAIPEVAAAVYSYTVSRQALPGTYVFFDIGSGTVEGASFRFWYENEMPQIDFYIGEVKPLGVHAIIKQVADKMGLPEVEPELEAFLVQNSSRLVKDISRRSESLQRQEVLRKGDFVANRWHISTQTVQQQLQNNQTEENQRLVYFMLKQHEIHQQVGQVIMETKAKHPEYYRTSARLPLFIGGGGSAIQFYQRTVSDTYYAFNHQHAGVPPYEVRSFPVPVDLKHREGLQQHFHRFAIAYGLSIPDYEMPEVRLPRLFPERSVPQSLVDRGSSTDGEYINTPIS